MQSAQKEPIAIIGIGCRFPRAENPQAFWHLLRTGNSAIREVPADRWKPDMLRAFGLTQSGKSVSRWGGFLDSIDTFDRSAFRIIPREVKFMDPQQRLLLEVAWEAFEDAGLPLEWVAGSRTGVFMGLIWHDYLHLQLRNWSSLDDYTATGNASSFAANRLSYFFNLKGPSLSLDAGCTSSLASIYLACHCLWSGEAELALAGGVNLMLSPDTMIFVSKTGMLSSAGSVRVLDAQADGFVRGEGAGIVVLKPLSKVQPSDRVYALIRGIATNHNGHNVWMIAPSESAQQALLQEAYQQAGVDPGKVDYVELQGTGFRRGDAIEVRALGAVLGASLQRRHPCRVGSVKTNIGHLEAASGIASLIKVALSLHHGEIPPTLNLETLNPEIPFAELGIVPQQEIGPWPTEASSRFAGVTTLALAGANAHAVLESFSGTSPETATTKIDGQSRVLPISAHSKKALEDQIHAMRAFLHDQAESQGPTWQNICYTASVRRTHREFRAAVVADSASEAACALDKLLTSTATGSLTVPDKSQTHQNRLIFLLPHSGIHWAELNIDVLLHEPATRKILDECNLIYASTTQQPLFRDLADLVHRSENFTTDPVRQQILTFAFQCALATLWHSWGVVPEAIAAEGSGEIAAGYITNAISLTEAIHILLSNPFSLKKGARTRGDRDNRGATVTAIPHITSTSGPLAGSHVIEVSHWEEQFQAPSLDINAIDGLCTAGYNTFISLGPHSALSGALLMLLQDHEQPGMVLASLGGSAKIFLETLGNLYTLGFTINWSKMYHGTEQCISLPVYPWQRERFWLDDMNADTIGIAPESQGMYSSRQNISDPEAAHADLNVETLTSLWADVLGLDKVDPSDSFFALGGHSLLASQLLTQIQSLYHVQITLEELLRAPTPLACLSLAQSRQSSSTSENIDLSHLPSLIARPTERYQPFPTTDIQQAYWLGRQSVFELGNVGNHGYIEVEATSFDVTRLQSILQQLIERHEMLRAVMLPDGQQQILEQTPPFFVEVEDLQSLPDLQQQQRLFEIRQEMDHELLPLEYWPAFRIRVCLLSAQRMRLHLSIESLFIDAWSMHLLIQEFTRLYWDPRAELPPLEISFRDYVLAEQSIKNHESYWLAQAYWTQRLATLPPPPELPLACNPAAIRHPRFVHYEGRLPAAQWQALKARGGQAGLTPSVVLLTAFAEVLAAWSKTLHFTINLTLFRRLPLHPRINDLVGDFTSLILLEVDCRTQRSFEERARLLEEQLWRDLDHSDYSGIRVIRELARSQGETARAFMPIVFTSLLVQDIASSHQAPWQETIYCVSQTPQVWLDHQVVEQRGDLVFHWQVVEDLFPAGLIADLFETYCRFINRLADDRLSWLEAARDLLPSHQLRLRQQRNATFCSRPDALLLHSQVLQQIALRPDDLAVITPGRRLRYRELHAGAASLAHQLRQAGAQPDRLVAVVMEKGWEQVVAVLAVLLSGAAYVPIDPSLPAERLHLLLAQSEVELLLTQPRLDSSLPWPPDIRRFCVDSHVLESCPPPVPQISSPDDLAYVIYTSGSTGIPKGVMIEHRNAVNTILDLNRRFSISCHDRILALSALNFDLSIYDIFGILAVGGAIVLPEGEESARDPGLWLELARAGKVTIWNTVPALLQMLVEYAESHPSALTNLHLRLAYLSGDWIPLTLPDRARALFPGLEVISMGGATEASIWSIIYPITTIEKRWSSIPYGWPMENQHWEILDHHLEPVPTWVVGHLYIGGRGLARGYWRDEKKTASSFIRHPRTGERLYRTGDLGRYWPDGTIEFLGREDFQAKVQGYRIELGEIEVTLRLHPLVQEAIAIAEGSPHGAKRLLAYVVPRSGTVLTHATLHSFLKERLPEYMVPSSLFLLDTLPLGANGKVDRKALLTMKPQEASDSLSAKAASVTPDRESSSPVNPLLSQVSKLVKEVLKISSISPTANLVECGATSLDIFRIANLLDSELQIRVEFGQLFRLSTVKAIAEYCQQLRTSTF